MTIRLSNSDQEVIGYMPADADAPTALRPFRPDDRVLKSELRDVPDAAWTDFVIAIRRGPHRGVGMFDMSLKRLADLGRVENVRDVFDPVIKRSVQKADWLAPLTKEQFEASPSIQYRLFVRSMQAYSAELRAGTVKRPTSVTESGALAILHRGGKSALTKWHQMQHPTTLALFRIVNGVF